MTIDQKRILKDAELKQDRLALPRRGFLQKCALVTGVFVAGFLRIDQNFAARRTRVKHYCCYLTKPKADCVIADCKSQFYWTCRWSAPGSSPVIIRCVECFDIEISLEGIEAFDGGWTEVEKHYEHLRCSKALHPADHDFAQF